MKAKTFIRNLKKSCCFNTEVEAHRALAIEDDLSIQNLAQNYFQAKEAFEKATRQFYDLILECKHDRRKISKKKYPCDKKAGVGPCPEICGQGCKFNKRKKHAEN